MFGGRSVQYWLENENVAHNLRDVHESKVYAKIHPPARCWWWMRFGHLMMLEEVTPLPCASFIVLAICSLL